VPGRVSEGPGHDSKAALLEFAEQKTLEYRAQKIAQEKAYAQWQKHYNEVERPRLERERRWSDAWASGSWLTIETTAEAMGGQYFVEYVQKFPQANSNQLRRAAALATDATQKAALEQRAVQADLRLAQEAEARKRAIAAERIRTGAAPGVGARGSSPGWDSWAAYRDQSARNATKLQAMHDYLYGKSNNPLLNPFK
jgi:hypothetical protein